MKSRFAITPPLQLLVPGVVIGALASTATPAHAASFVWGCFQRPAGPDPATWTVRVDLRVWNQVKQVWQQTGQYAFIQISPAAPTCQYFNVPTAYQNYYTTIVVDYTYTQSGTTLQWYGWAGQHAPPGTMAFPQVIPPVAFTKFRNWSSADGLGVHTAYWH